MRNVAYYYVDTVSLLVIILLLIQANVHGVGVVGVIEADFLTPIHNKQDFNKTDR